MWQANAIDKLITCIASFGGGRMRVEFKWNKEPEELILFWVYGIIPNHEGSLPQLWISPH